MVDKASIVLSSRNTILIALILYGELLNYLFWLILESPLQKRLDDELRSFKVEG
jgi:hypothetical protein